MPSVEPPKKAQVLVVGGGPAGSYAAATLAREGFDVVLFEMSKFPRYHIGESLIPSVRHYLRFIDAEKKVAAHGFARKPGSAIKFNQYMREGYTDFIALGAENNAWNVVRSEFDQLLLEHASSCGVRVFEQTRVTDIIFAEVDHKDANNGADRPRYQRTPSASGRPLPPVNENGSDVDCDLGRPVMAAYETVLGGRGSIEFDFLVDATGRAGLMSTRYLKNRRFNEALKNVAVWGYWRGTGMYGEGTDRENAPWFEALSDESGWAWFIPLHNGLTSVGVVMEQKQLGLRSRASSSASTTSSSPLGATRPRSLSIRTSSTLAERYLSLLQLAPGVLRLIGDGELASVSEEGSDEDGPAVKSASDFSYSADTYAGEGWRIVGDAGAFIDPFFSSGVHLAFTGALSAAVSISASVRGDCTESEAVAWHSSRVAISYTRFLVVVLSAYKQIRAQSSNVLSDIDEDNFDKAFACLRPVIQGGAEMGARLSEDELQRALDFCVHLFSPTTPEQHELVRKRLESMGLGISAEWQDNRPHSAPIAEHLDHTDGKKSNAALLDVRAPVINPAKLNEILSQHQRRAAMVADAPSGDSRRKTCDEDSEVKMVLEKVNARRVIHAEHGNGLNSFEEEAVEGFVVRLQRSQLGLMKPV